MPFDTAPRENFARLPALGEIAAAAETASCRHPYLLVRRSDIAALRRRANRTRQLTKLVNRCLVESLDMSAGAGSREQIKRRARRLIVLAFGALVAPDANPAAFDAARSSLLELSAMPSWRPRAVIRSFLDAAETAIAVALGYDWLHDRLSAAERHLVEEALFRNILAPAAASYADESNTWIGRAENFTFASHAGVAISALAALPCYRGEATALLHRVVASAWSSFAAFAPDGGWREGPSYWSPTVRSAGLLVSALENALGTSFGLAERPGFSHTGQFALHATGPSGMSFDFGDSVPQYDRAPLVWFTHRFARPFEEPLVTEYDGWHLPLTMIWSRGPTSLPDRVPVPTAKVFHGCQLACFRNEWSVGEPDNSVYLAIKGNPAATPLHAQADAGTFVLETGGKRWALDLGPDDYDLPGYFDHGTREIPGRRWQYYRASTAGHNTLAINGRNQIPGAPTAILGSCVDGPSRWVVIDMSAAYASQAQTVQRGAALIGDRVLLQDEVRETGSAGVVWTMHTSAEPLAVSKRAATLRLGTDELSIAILAPRRARLHITRPPAPRRFAIVDKTTLHGHPADDFVCERPWRDGDGREVRRLEIRWPRGARRLTVLLSPGNAAAPDNFRATPLEDWLAGRPLYRPRHGREPPAALPARDAAARPARNLSAGGRQMRNALSQSGNGGSATSSASAMPLLLPALMMASVMGIGASSILVPSVPHMARALGTSIAAVQGTFAIYLAAFAGGMLVLGPLADRYGHRRVMLAGTGLCALGSLAGALSPSIGFLVAARIAQGMGACAGAVVARAIVADRYGREQAARVLAALAFAVTSIQLLAPVAGGQFETGIGWRASFAAIALCSGAAFLLAGRALPADKKRPDGPPRFQEIGAAYGKLLGSRPFVAYALIAAGAHAGSHAFAVGAPALLISGFAVTPAHCGAYVALPALGFLAGSFLARRLLKTMGADRLIAMGLAALIAGGLIMLILAITGHTGAAPLIGPMIAISAASGIVTPNAVAGSLGAEHDGMRGLAAGLITFLQIAGGMMATMALALLPAVSCSTLSIIIALGGPTALIGYLWLKWPRRLRALG